MRRFIISLTLMIACVTSMVAQVSFTTIVERNVEVGKKFYVTFRLKNGEGSGLKPPQIKGCKYIYGPSISTMSSTQIINGRASSSTTVDYSFIYLAESECSTSVPATTINVGGTVYTAPTTSFNIGPARSPQQGGSSQGNPYAQTTPQNSSNLKKITNKDVFVRIILAKAKVYEQEAVLCTTKLFLAEELGIDGRKSQIMSQPSYEGFMVEELPTPNRTDSEMYNGRRYHTSVLNQCILFPQRSGKLTVTSGKYELTVQQYQTVYSGYLAYNTPVDSKISIESNTATLDVTPLPSPRPASFSGAVGEFTVTTELHPTDLATGEAGELIYTINGIGNLKYIPTPTIDFPSEVEKYTPKTDQDIKVTGSNLTGINRITYAFTPQKVGSFDIRVGEFTYFDLKSQKYVTVDLPTYTINVKQGAGKSTSKSAGNQEEITEKNTDILPLHRGAEGQSKSQTYVIFTWWYWVIFGGCALALAITVLTSIHRIRRNANVTARNFAKANKVARRRLKLARQLMKAHQSDQFYLEITRAIWGYLSHKLAIPTSQLSRENVKAQLSAYGAPDELSDMFIDILDQAEMTRFAPTESDSAMEDLYKSAATAMDELESVKPIKNAKA